jgi:hypothetical protein
MLFQVINGEGSQHLFVLRIGVADSDKYTCLPCHGKVIMLCAIEERPMGLNELFELINVDASQPLFLTQKWSSDVQWLTVILLAMPWSMSCCVLAALVEEDH